MLGITHHQQHYVFAVHSRHGGIAGSLPFRWEVKQTPLLRERTHGAYKRSPTNIVGRETHVFITDSSSLFRTVVTAVDAQNKRRQLPFLFLRSSVIRMFLQRCRYLRAKVALKAWRTDHSVPVLQCLRGEVVRQKTIEIGLQSVRCNATAVIRVLYVRHLSG